MLGERAGLAASLVFALHPIQAQAVNYIWARGELLGAALGFAALLAWFKGLRWIALPCFAAALLANEYAAALPVVILLFPAGAKGPDGWTFPARATWKDRVLLGANLFLSAVALSRRVYLARAAHGAPVWWKYFEAEGPAIFRYLRLLVVPYGFSLDPDVRAPALWAAVLAWVAILAAGLCAWRWRDRAPVRWALAGLLLLLPASSVLAMRDPYADSRMYLPMLAFAGAAGLLLTRVKTQALAVAAALILGALSVARTAVWMNDKWLWQEAVRRAPEKARPKVQLSRNLPAADALEMLQRAQVADPHDPTVPAEMGKVLLQERQVDPALIEFGQALALDPNNAEYYDDRGVALAMSGWTDRARADFERALEIDPNLSEATANLKKLPPAQ